MFFGRDGAELTDLRVQGEIDADALAQHLQAVLASRPSGTASATYDEGEKSVNFAKIEAI